MRGFAYEIELLEDVVASASGATAGGHRSLDYLPGAMFLGTAASKLYSKLTADEAFTVFHSGRVRFLTAFPLGPDGQPCLPLPRSFHLEKYGTLRLGDGLPDKASDDLQNLARPVANGGKQMERPEPVEGRFLSASGEIVRTPKGRTLRTAIDPATRRRAETQLFGYEAIRAGTRFLAEVHLDDGVDSSLEGALKKTLCETVIRLGRSKLKEYGNARTGPAQPLAAWQVNNSGDDLLLIYLRSDLALLDRVTGQPTLEPTPRMFELPEGAEIAWEHTFLRARRFSPINSKRRRPDLEHQVLVQGSVIAFRFPNGSPPDLEELRARLAPGIGAYRAEGLGQLLVEPAFLAERLVAKKAFAAAGAASAFASSARLEAEKEDLLIWAVGHAKLRRDREEAYEQAGKWLETLSRKAMASNAPGRSQWGLVRERALIAEDAEALSLDLFGPKPVQEGGESDAGLLRSGVRKTAWRGLVDILSGCFNKERNEGNSAMHHEAMILLAARMQKELQGRGRR